MATISATAARANQPYTPHEGSLLALRHQTYVTTATLSDTDVIIFSQLKIPHGATIHRIRLWSDTPDGSGIFQVGINGSAALFGSATYSATAQIDDLTTGLPYAVSVSDDAADRFVTMQLTQNGAQTSGTASVSVTLEVQYTMD